MTRKSEVIGSPVGFSTANALALSIVSRCDTAQRTFLRAVSLFTAQLITSKPPLKLRS